MSTIRFGTQLRAQRIKNNLSTQELANLCRVSRSYVTLMENNKRLPGAKVIPLLAVALSLKTNVVLNWYLEDRRFGLEQKINKSSRTH